MASPPRFKIVVYASTDPDDTPETAQFVAGLFIGYDTYARWTCSGATAEEARAKIEAFWAKEQKSHAPRTPPPKSPAPSPAVVEDEGEVL